MVQNNLKNSLDNKFKKYFNIKWQIPKKFVVYMDKEQNR